MQSAGRLELWLLSASSPRGTYKNRLSRVAHLHQCGCPCVLQSELSSDVTTRRCQEGALPRQSTRHKHS
jgi:hypothetical protein